MAASSAAPLKPWRTIEPIQCGFATRARKIRRVSSASVRTRARCGSAESPRYAAGSAPRAYIGDSTRPESVRTRSLTEETARVFRARVVNPKWLQAMRRHGYKGAFELAATVDYLFGYDATTGVVADWMYEKLAQTYVLDPENREFMERSNPWALHGIAERLLEAVDRQMWAEPDPALLAELQQAYLDTEGDLEGGETPASSRS